MKHNNQGLVKFLRILAKTIGVVLAIALFLILVIQLPPVQNALRKKLVTYLENRLHTKVEIGHINIMLPNVVSLQDVYFEDQQKDTLFSGGKIDLNINLLKLAFNSEVDIRKLKFENLTANIKRILPDTVYNFQFIADAFTKKKTVTVADSTTATYSIPDLVLNNIHFIYKDTLTGMDIDGVLQHMETELDAFDPVKSIYVVPTTLVQGLTAHVYQSKPLVKPEPLIADEIQALKPKSSLFNLGKARLQNVQIDFRNNVSSFYTTVNIGDLQVQAKRFDLVNRIIELDNLSLENSMANIRLGKSPPAREVEKQVEQEAISQAQAGWRIAVKNLKIDNDKLSFDNENHPRQSRGMDYAHLKSDDFTLHVTDFVLNADSIGGNISEAHFTEQGGFKLDELRAGVLYARTELYLKDLYLKTPGSEIKRNAVMHYASYDALAKHFNNTEMELDIDNSYVLVKDILQFVPQLSRNAAFSNPNATWYLNLQANGTLSSLHIEDIRFRGLKNTVIDAGGSLALGSASKTGGALTIRRLHTTQSDIALFTGSRLSTPTMRLPEEFDASGSLRGGVNGVTTNLQINSSIGNVHAVGTINNMSDLARASYQGTLSSSSLNLGYMLMNPMIGSVSANMQVKGKGLQPGSMNAAFNGVVHAINVNGYTYRNIKANGTLARDAYHVNADVNDPNIAFNGTIDGTTSLPSSFSINGFADSIKLMPLHFTTVPVVFRGKIDANIPYMSQDYLDADVTLTNVLLVSRSQRLQLDTVLFASGHNDSLSFMHLQSDVANASLQGHYRYGDLGNIFLNSIQPYFDVSGPGKNVRTAPYDITFNADLASSPVIADLVPGLVSYQPIHISGSANNVNGLNATATSNYIDFQGNQATGINLQIQTTAQGLAITGKLQRLRNKALELYQTDFNAIARNNELDFHLGTKDIRGRDRYLLSGLLKQPQTGTYVLSLRSDSLMLNYQRWTIAPGNSLSFNGKQIIAQNFNLQNGAQQLSLQSSGEILNARFTNFQLSTITAFMQSDSTMANGSMNGTMAFRNILVQPVFTSDLNIQDLSIRGDTLGNAAIKVDNTSGDRYNATATITGRGNDVSLKGSFAPLGSNDIALDLDLAIRQLQLSTIDGALGSFIQNSSGSIDGNISIKGSVNHPKINGPVNFNNASFAFTMLGSQFKVDNEKLLVTENGIHFDEFVIRDTSNNELHLNGDVETSDLTHYNFDLDVNADNFKILHTTKTQSKLYYGDVVITTDMHLGGTETKPIVDGSLVVNDGTNLSIVIPQRQPGVVDRQGIVEFVNMNAPENDTLFKAFDSLNYSSFMGMDIAANIEIKKEAIFNIIIDEANGDFLNLQGEAQITTGIDPSGKITMVGNYELERGAYEITFNFLHRRFDIVKGSRIEWLNEPTKANLDVHAVYIANTSPIDLVQNQISAATPQIRNTYLQKLPFEVHLNMTGELLQPVVTFDITLPENKNYGVSNDIITQVDSRLSQIRTDPGEINKQVFALLLFNRFVGENPLQSSASAFNASSYVRQSVSKLLTEQLNQLAAGIIDGVDINFDVASTDDYTTGERRSRTDLTIGLSKQLLNERLTVSVGTNFEIEGGKYTKQKSSNALGNVSVDYALTRDRRYLIRFYRKNEYQGVVDGYVIETGLSFIISVDYEKFREILTRRKKQKLEGVH